MGPLSYLHSGLPKISGVWILPYCIGDREATENAEWDTLQFVKVGDPTKGLTTMYGTSPESWALGAVDGIGFKLIAAVLCSQSITEVPGWLPPYSRKTPFLSFSGKRETKPLHYLG